MRTLLSFIVVTCLTPSISIAEEGMQVVKLKDVKWSSCDPQNPKDACQISYFHGNPEKEANHSYFKVPRGYTFGAHWHTSNSHIVVVKGAFTVGGEQDQKGITFQSGDYGFEPAKWIHWGKCIADECVVYLYVDGPDSYIDINDRRP